MLWVQSCGVLERLDRVVEPRGPLRDVARAQADDLVACPHLARQRGGEPPRPFLRLQRAGAIEDRAAGTRQPHGGVDQGVDAFLVAEARDGKDERLVIADLPLPTQGRVLSLPGAAKLCAVRMQTMANTRFLVPLACK